MLNPVNFEQGIIVARAVLTPITEQFSYFNQLVNDCVDKIRKGKVMYCFDMEQVQAICDKCRCTVEIQNFDWYYMLTKS